MTVLKPLRMTRASLGHALLKGGAASSAYLVAQAVDRRMTGNRYDDLILWGGLISRRPRWQRLIGLAAHYTLGTVLAVTYDAARPSLPRLPGWLLGFVFVQTENTVLFPAVAVMNRIHPEVRRGTLPPLWTWQYFWLEAVRHAAYGIVLGLLPANDSEATES